MKGILLLLLAFVLAACGPQPTPEPPTPVPPTPALPTPTPTAEWERAGWKLIWQDEFSGEALNPSKWQIETGGHGWGNNEWEFYTDRPENLRVEDGLLVIEARKEEFIRRDYTSARIKTQSLFTFTYGRVEARMKLPYGQGIWPAFWMLGEDIDTVGWPGSGEIDIMEHIGREPTRIYGTVHGPGYSGASGIGHFTTLPSGSLSEQFHVFAIEWEPDEIRWFVDDNQFFKLTPQEVTGDWVYDHPFFILLNLAVGGNWPGYPDASTVFPQFLQVDYVRVYQTPDMAAEYQTVPGGSMHIGDFQVSAVQAANGSQVLASITVVDQDGSPVPGAKVTGGWVGTVTKGETSALTDPAGAVNLLSDATEKSGEVTFCVTSISRSGYQYDKTANLLTCAKVELKNETSSPAYENIPGVYLGTFHGTQSSSVSLFDKIGKDIAISAVYLNWSSAFNNGFLNSNAQVGRISFLTWEFMPGASRKLQDYEGRILEAIVDGLYDDYLTSWAEGMRAFGKPVFLRFGHEMNGYWYPWSGVKNGAGVLNGYGSPNLPDGPERFVDAYRYIHNHFRKAGAENVLWVWCLNAPFSVMEQALGPWNTATAYYPGDEYVDWMCFDGYNWGSSAFGQQFNAQWNSFDEIFGSSYLELQAINSEKPIIIGEFASTEEGGSKAAWISNAFSSIRLKYPQIRALIWFHISKETDWRINSSDAALEAYRDAVSDDYWLSDWPEMLP